MAYRDKRNDKANQSKSNKTSSSKKADASENNEQSLEQVLEKETVTTAQEEVVITSENASTSENALTLESATSSVMSINSNNDSSTQLMAEQQARTLKAYALRKDNTSTSSNEDTKLSDFKTAGALLKHHRLVANLSINEVATHIKSRVPTIYDIENDRLMDVTNYTFTVKLISQYAEYVGLDPKYVVELYEKNFSANIQINHQVQRKEIKVNHGKRNWILIGLMIVVASVGVFIFKDDNKAQVSSDDGVLLADGTEVRESTLRNSNQQNDDKGVIDLVESNSLGNKDGSSGSLIASADGQIVDQGTLNAKSSSEAQVVIEEAQDTKVVVVDQNTAKALAQAEALQNKADSGKSNTSAQKEALALPNSPKMSIESVNAPDIERNTFVSAKDSSSISEKAKTDSTTKVNSIAQADSTAKVDTTTKTDVATEVQDKAKDKQDSSKTTASSVLASNKDNNNKQVVEDNKEEAEQAPKITLNAKLKDVSSQVKVKNREGLASLNSVSISFKADAAIKVTDGSNKVLQEGSFTKGKNLKITGIPPIKVAVSDTSAINISYMGGTLSMPKDKQVIFELPLR